MRIFDHRIEIPEFSLEEWLCFVIHFAYYETNQTKSNEIELRVLKKIIGFMRLK